MLNTIIFAQNLKNHEINSFQNPDKLMAVCYVGNMNHKNLFVSRGEYQFGRNTLINKEESEQYNANPRQNYFKKSKTTLAID